jgi:xylulokinase
MIALGAGGSRAGKTHCYIGTSGWAATTTSRRLTDLKGMAGSILAAPPGLYNYISELETAGRCLEWVKNHLALDEIGVYLKDQSIADHLQLEKTLYHYLSSVVSATPAGSNGLIFTPWLHGSRSPFEDPYARGMFFNIGLDTKKRHMIRAVLEGVAFNLRWMLETLERKADYADTIMFVGGGAQSSAWAQILADVTGRTVQVSDNAQYAGTNGTAMLVAAGLAKQDIKQTIADPTIHETYVPDSSHKTTYDKQYSVFKALSVSNRKLFTALNRTC